MSDVAEVIDGEIVGHAVAIRQPVTLVPQTTAGDLVARLDVIRGAMEQAMQKDVDYGVIPGTGKKPTLLKPGAEKLAVLFQMDVQIENEKLWGDNGHLTVISKATVFHIPSGSRIASGEGMCSTREAKYAFRQSERVCPTCGQPAIIKGKAEYGGGWVCFKRKGGCGAKFKDSDPAIAGQAVGQVPNPNIADTYNTVDKMASKRARVDAILAATGASALFTQDAEDLPPTHEAHAPTVDIDGDPGPVDEGKFPPADHPEPGPLRERHKAMAQKLDILVTKLRDAGKLTTEHLYTAMGRKPVPGDDGVLHWGPLRDSLSRDEAKTLIDRLVKLEQNVAAQEAAVDAAASEFKVPDSVLAQEQLA